MIIALVVVARCTSQVIVEWRALTVCLLDEVAATLRQKLGKSEEEFPLVKVCAELCGDWLGSAEGKLPLLVEGHACCCFGHSGEETAEKEMVGTIRVLFVEKYGVI